MNPDELAALKRKIRQETIDELAGHFAEAPVTPNKRETAKSVLRWAIGRMNAS